MLDYDLVKNFLQRITPKIVQKLLKNYKIFGWIFCVAILQSSRKTLKSVINKMNNSTKIWR